jgi:hypothetical protein
MTTVKLIRWSGVAAIAGGIILAITAIITGLAEMSTPVEEALSVTARTNVWQITMPLMLAAMILVLLGLAGLYGRQAEQAGSFGLVAFVFAFVGTALAVGLMWVFAFVVPTLAEAAPAVLDAEEPPGTLGVALFLSFILFTLGWLLFGVASLRTRVFPRWASVLLIIGAILSFIVDILPFDMPIPLDLLVLGTGLAWMGYTLWSGTARPAVIPEAAVEY